MNAGRHDTARSETQIIVIPHSSAESLPALIKLGVGALSVAPPLIPWVKDILRGLHT